MAAESRDLLDQREAGPVVRAGPHNQDTDLAGRLADGDDHVVLRARSILERVERGERDRAIVERIERRPAARTEHAGRGLRWPH